MCLMSLHISLSIQNNKFMQRIHIFVVYIGEASKIYERGGQMNDEKIVDLYWERTETAIDETAKIYGNYLFTIANNILQNTEDAKECVNDTYLKAWNNIPPVRPAIFQAFLGKITRNLSLNKYKEQRAKKRGGGEADLIYSELEDCISSKNSVEGEYEKGLITKAINSFLISLRTENRVVFVRRYWYADSVRVIADRLQMSESKVKSMLFRTRKALKTYLENEGVIL